MILKVKIKVNDEIEAYKLGSELGFEYTVMNADLDGHSEDFTAKNKPAHFLKDKKRPAPKFFSKGDAKPRVN